MTLDRAAPALPAPAARRDPARRAHRRVADPGLRAALDRLLATRKASA
ncbi:MAG: hypothetical protein R3F43_08100 [bacterium]